MRRIITGLLVILIAVNFLYTISGVVNFPLRSVDVYAIWMFKAKAFYVYQDFPLEFLKTIGYSHPQYPILLPFLFYQIFMLFGEFREIYVLAFYPFVYLLILFLAYKFFLKLNLSKNQSLLFTYIYSMFSPLLAQAGRNHAGTADIVITFIYWLMLFVIYNYLKVKKAKHLFLLVFLIIIASQIKQEGLFSAAVILFLPLERKKKLALVLIAATPTVLWIYTRIRLGIPSDLGLIMPDIFLIVLRLKIVILGIAREMLNIRNWYVFWFVFWFVVVLKSSKDNIIKKVVEPSLILISLAFISVYIFTGIDTAAYVSSSVDRIFLQLSPFIFVIFVHRIKIVSDKIL